MNNIGLVDLSKYTLKDARELLSWFVKDGWEILAIKQEPDGVWALVQERVLEWIER